MSAERLQRFGHDWYQGFPHVRKWVYIYIYIYIIGNWLSTPHVVLFFIRTNWNLPRLKENRHAYLHITGNNQIAKIVAFYRGCSEFQSSLRWSFSSLGHHKCRKPKYQKPGCVLEENGFNLICSTACGTTAANISLIRFTVIYGRSPKWELESNKFGSWFPAHFRGGGLGSHLGRRWKKRYRLWITKVGWED